jgi:hypothetical protein
MGMDFQPNQPLGFAFTFLNKIRPNSLAFFFTGPTWRPRDFAMSSALTFFLVDALSRRVSASVHGRVTSPSPSPSALGVPAASRRLAEKLFANEIFQSPEVC